MQFVVNWRPKGWKRSSQCFCCQWHDHELCATKATFVRVWTISLNCFSNATKITSFCKKCQAQRNGIYIILLHMEQKLWELKILEVYAWVQLWYIYVMQLSVLTPHQYKDSKVCGAWSLGRFDCSFYCHSIYCTTHGYILSMLWSTTAILLPNNTWTVIKLHMHRCAVHSSHNSSQLQFTETNASYSWSLGWFDCS